MIVFILGAVLFGLFSFVLFCILHCTTDYDHFVDDEMQELFLRRYSGRL